ncbi:hypothetical protein F5883DRAFT_222680 [Diaporthe sp. PMI_573]|nr:hypothetical protein F5883DRAFT_222680 [Diaporthaceae sp. PMI_573]
MEVRITWLEACPVVAAVVTSWWGLFGRQIHSIVSKISHHNLNDTLISTHLYSSQLGQLWPCLRASWEPFQRSATWHNSGRGIMSFCTVNFDTSMGSTSTFLCNRSWRVL